MVDIELSPFGKRVRDIANDPRCNSYIGCFAAAVDPDDDESSSKKPESSPKVIEPRPGGQFPGQFIGPMLPPEIIPLMEVMNNDDIVLDSQMVKEINDPEIRMLPNGEIAKLVRTRKRTRKPRKPSGRDVIRRSGQFGLQNILPNLPTKKKRKVSNYQKEFGKQLKLLKKKHPRTKISNLMGKAHRATRKKMKK